MILVSWKAPPRPVGGASTCVTFFATAATDSSTTTLPDGLVSVNFEMRPSPFDTGSRLLGSLLLWLYDDDGLLYHVGFTSAFKKSERPALTKRFETLKKEPG